MKSLSGIILFIVLLLAISSYPLSPKKTITLEKASRIMDTDSYIDANYLLMFVTNKGSFAYDQGGILGKNDGFYYPYVGIDNILDGTYSKTICFAGGIWIAGVDSATGDTLVSVSDYSDDYFPGPMINGTYVLNANTDPQYRVYKLYADSQFSNPNQDYLDWPISQGAPADAAGNPQLFGDQTLWSVFNDANPIMHSNDAGSNTGMGIEIQHTVWASTDSIGSDTLPAPTTLAVQQLGSSVTFVTVAIIDANAFTGHEYVVVTDNDVVLGPVWHLIDITQGDTILANQTGFDQEYSLTEGFAVRVSNGIGIFESFEVVANATGPLVPPSGGAFEFQNFPSINPDDNQQVGAGLWAIHTGDNGGTSGGGTRGSYESFLSRVIRNDNKDRIGLNDFEMRFTGSNLNPGVNGSYAIRAFQDDFVYWVPFELWRTGKETPDDFSDDLRLTPWIFDMGDDSTYNLENWGNATNGNGAFEHSASGSDDDPYTDWVYWYLPLDTTAGQSGYLADQTAMLAGTYSFNGLEIMARTVLINWNGGYEPPFSQDLPEQGTVFRIRSFKTIEVDSFRFTAALPPIVTTGSEGVSIYSKYKLINRSPKSYKNFFISLWFDPDIGDASDDLVGCDTNKNIFYSYNAGSDNVYGDEAPAFGGRLLEGPVVPAKGDTAHINGAPVPNYKNLRVYSFFRFIGADAPISPRSTYQYMNGLLPYDGTPLPNGTRFMFAGDPVTGTGELDADVSDRSMFASFGPFDFGPGSSNQVIVKMGVGQGTSHLNSITELKEVLDSYDIPVVNCCIDTRGDIDGNGVDNDLSDLTYMINNIFRGGPAPICTNEADLNSDGAIANILDLTFLVDDIYRGGPSPASCSL